MDRYTLNMTIGNLVFNYVTDINIKSSWKNFTDTAVIKMPSNLKLQSKKLKELVKAGDTVTISPGFNFKNKNRFSGFIRSTKPTTPLEFECEDNMWPLKQNSITKSWKSIRLPDMIAYILKQANFTGPTKILDADLGAYTINNLSVAKILLKLKDEYGLFSFFRRGVLNVGFPYDPETAQEVIFAFGHNIAVEGNTLEYRSATDSKLKVKAISMFPNNTKIEVELGDQDGEERTLHFYKLSKTELEAAAKREIDKLRFDGYRGKFKTLGEPLVWHGDIAFIKNDENPEMSGKYFIDSVEVPSGIGYFQIIELGPKVN